MSYLLEALGRGLLCQLADAFEHQLPLIKGDRLLELRARREQSPGSLDLAVRHGVACLREMKLREAHAAFQAAHELAPRQARPLLGLACVADERADRGEALRCLRNARERDPSDPAIEFAIAFCQERQGDLPGATASYRGALHLCPELRNAYERLAAIALYRGELDQALDQYARLADFEPEDVDVRMTVGALELQRGNAEAAIESFQRALLVEPQALEEVPTPDELEGEDGLRDAVRKLEKLARKYPSVADFHVHLADLHARLRDDDRAVREYRTALDLQPGYLEATVKLGTQHLRQGRYLDAAQTFHRAIELNDRLTAAFVGLGVAQLTAGRQAEADATFDLAASLAPNSNMLFAESLRLHACGGREAGDLELPESAPELLAAAVRAHQQALIFAPGYADLHYRHGLLLRQADRTRAAAAAFDQAVRINPHHARAQLKLGLCLRELGRRPRGERALRRAWETRPGDIGVHYQLALLFAHGHRFDLAAEHFDATVAQPRNNLAFRQNLALSLQIVGLVDRAAASWHSVCELSAQTREAIRERGVTALLD